VSRSAWRDGRPAFPARRMGFRIAAASHFQYAGNMESRNAVAALSALAHEGRLAAFRLLVKAGRAGLAAGVLARSLGVLPNTLSANLTILNHAGLVESRRAGKSVIYSVRFAEMAALLQFLVEDCCAGSPDICAPLMEIVLACDCDDGNRDMADG
jgi:ArsR family transcriptional regulator, arsenate/arsenite/antimonite-responsive transcriptional repressor